LHSQKVVAELKTFTSVCMGLLQSDVSCLSADTWTIMHKHQYGKLLRWWLCLRILWNQVFLLSIHSWTTWCFF